MRARAILRIFEEMEASHLRPPEINSGEAAYLSDREILATYGTRWAHRGRGWQVRCFFSFLAGEKGLLFSF
jgi:hypothetical protein